MTRCSRLGWTLGALIALLASACTVSPTSEGTAIATVSQPIAKTDTRKVYVHVMPWFEPDGLHWNNGRHYNPQIGEYHSGDYNVIEYQLLLMKYSGIDGVIIDWPGRSTMYNDLPDNAQNTDQMIDQTAKFGMEFAVCFEDQYAEGAGDAINSMYWVRDHYFNQPNHIVINGAPALFVFGPQGIGEGDWPSVLAATGTDPSFFTLWYDDDAGNARDGTYAWIYSDALGGVEEYYGRGDQGLKIPVLYPGFNAAYEDGGPGWGVGYDLGGDTFTSLWNLALDAGEVLQIATWNDYTEGTMVEPTNEFGYRFLTTLQDLVGAVYGEEELEIVRLLYDRRQAGDPNAEAASQALANLDVAGACAALGCTAPVREGSGGTTSSGGSPNNGGMTNTGATTSSGGMTNSGASSSGGTTSSGASSSGGGSNSGGSSSGDRRAPEEGGCSVSPAGSSPSPARLWLALATLAIAVRRRRASQA